MRYYFCALFFACLALLCFYGWTAQLQEEVADTPSLPFDYTLSSMPEVFLERLIESMDRSLAVLDNPEVESVLIQTEGISDPHVDEELIRSYADQYIEILNKQSREPGIRELKVRTLLSDEYQAVLATLQRMHDKRVQSIVNLSSFVTEFQKSREQFEQDVRFWNVVFIDKVFSVLKGDLPRLLTADDLLPLYKDLQNAADVIDRLYAQGEKSEQAEQVYKNQNDELQAYLDERMSFRMASYSRPSALKLEEQGESLESPSEQQQSLIGARSLWSIGLKGLLAMPEEKSEKRTDIYDLSSPAIISVEELAGSESVNENKSIQADVSEAGVPKFSPGHFDKIMRQAWILMYGSRALKIGFTGVLAAVVVLWKLKKQRLWLF